MKLWQSHLEHAEALLKLARAKDEVPAKSLDCLYEALVSLTRAINELEGKEAHGHGI